MIFRLSETTGIDQAQKRQEAERRKAIEEDGIDKNSTQWKYFPFVNDLTVNSYFFIITCILRICQ